MIDDKHFKETQRIAVEKFFKIPGVRSVAIGPKYSNGHPTGEMAIVVGVERKRPVSQVPVSQMIPAIINGIKTDVVERLEQVPIQCTNVKEDDTRYRPLRGGTQIEANNRSGLGTMGFLAFTTGAIPTVDEDLIVGVTCHHVVAGPAGVTIGESVGQATPDDCSDCSPCCIDVIGKIAYAVKNAADGSLVDGAIIDLSSGLEYYNDVHEIGAVSGFHSVQPSDLRVTQPHYPVKKRGRTTGLTTGDVLTVSGTSVIDGATFRDAEITVQPDVTTPTWCKCGPIPGSGVPNLRAFACEGDSGSALLNQSDEVVGLIRNRDASGNGYATGIDIVMKALGILVGTAAEEQDKRVVPPHPHAAGPHPASPMSTISTRQRAILERAQQEILATASGKLYAELVAKHQIEVRDLINNNKRMATIWHRNNGPQILNEGLLALGDATKVLPSELNGIALTDSVTKIVKAMQKYGSTGLREDIIRYQPPLAELPGMTYPQLLNRLRDTHVD